MGRRCRGEGETYQNIQRCFKVKLCYFVCLNLKTVDFSTQDSLPSSVAMEATPFLGPLRLLLASSDSVLYPSVLS